MKPFKYLFLIRALILSACDSDSDPFSDLSVTFWLDNPLNTAINVTLNDGTYQLEPMSGS